jgi:hypothetical protein
LFLFVFRYETIFAKLIKLQVRNNIFILGFCILLRVIIKYFVNCCEKEGIIIYSLRNNMCHDNSVEHCLYILYGSAVGKGR